MKTGAKACYHASQPATDGSADELQTRTSKFSSALASNNDFRRWDDCSSVDSSVAVAGLGSFSPCQPVSSNRGGSRRNANTATRARATGGVFPRRHRTAATRDTHLADQHDLHRGNALIKVFLRLHNRSQRRRRQQGRRQHRALAQQPQKPQNARPAMPSVPNDCRWGRNHTFSLSFSLAEPFSTSNCSRTRRTSFSGLLRRKKSCGATAVHSPTNVTARTATPARTGVLDNCKCCLLQHRQRRRNHTATAARESPLAVERQCGGGVANHFRSFLVGNRHGSL